MKIMLTGATAFEFQVGKLCVRILRPRAYFWPYRHFITKKLQWPAIIRFQWVHH